MMKIEEDQSNKKLHNLKELRKRQLKIMELLHLLIRIKDNYQNYNNYLKIVLISKNYLKLKVKRNVLNATALS